MQLKYLLVMQTEGAALQSIRQSSGGLSGYRAMARRHNPRSQARAPTQLQDNMSFAFGSSPTELLDRVMTFDRMVVEYEASTRESLPSSVKIAVLLKRSPPPVRAHLLLTCRMSPDFAGMRSAMEGSVVTGRTWNTSGIAAAQGTAPMKVDAVFGGKAKGKSKGKSKQAKGTGDGKKKKRDGKNKSGGHQKSCAAENCEVSEGYCGNCGARGGEARLQRKEEGSALLSVPLRQRTSCPWRGPAAGSSRRWRRTPASRHRGPIRRPCCPSCWPRT